MGADLYLHTVLQECYTRYGHAYHLVDEARRLACGDIWPASRAESQHLKEALTSHAELTGEMSPTLFDLVAEIADLSQGEDTVWIMVLAEQVAALIHRMDEEGKRGSDTEQTGPAFLAQNLVDVLKGRLDAPIRQGAAFLVQRLEHMAGQIPPEKEVVIRSLAELGKSMEETLEGNPSNALGILLEKRVIPSLEHSCADQERCLNDLTLALEPILPAGPASLIGELAFTPGQALAKFCDLTSRFHEATDTLRTHLSAALHAQEFRSEQIARQFAHACATLQALNGEARELQPELEEAMKTLAELLMRTVTPSESSDNGVPDATFPTSSPSASSSPLHRAFGTILRHNVICEGTLGLVEQSASATERLLSGEPGPALLEICQGMIALLYADHERARQDAQEPSLSGQIVPHVSQAISLVPGVTLCPGTLMDLCYAQVTASVSQMHHQNQVRDWIKSALEDEQPVAEAPRIILRFFLMLQGNPTLWAQLLVEQLREALLQEIVPIPERDQALAQLTQLGAMLEGHPTLRLQALLTDVCAHIPPYSPLSRPATRLLQLMRGEWSDHLTEALGKLSQEVQCHREWPEEDTRDVSFLLDLGLALVQASEEQHARLILTALASQCDACSGEAQSELDAGMRARLMQALSSTDDDGAMLRALQRLLESLPEPGPQPPRADPRLVSTWRFHLLHDLIARKANMDKGEAARATGQGSASGQLPAFLLVEPILRIATQMFHAWLFPPQGYFRDPYNDASILWLAAGAFWPALANQIAEPCTHQISSWQEEEGDIPAQIPLFRVRDLLALVTAHSLHLPERHHLTRWGPDTIRVEESGPYSLSAWHTHFEERRHALAAFLEEALAREEPILCSL